MTVLTPVQIKLAEQLLLSVKKHESNIEYNELAARITPPIHWRQVGKNLVEISKLCHELGLPLLSAKVINKRTHKAGVGFFALYESFGIPTNGKTETELYHEERKAIRECAEWYKLEDYLGLNIGFDRPNTVAANAPTQPKCDTATLNNRNYFEDNAFSEAPEIPPVYQSPNIRFLNSQNPTAFLKSVDVINYAFGPHYLGKYYNCWQKGAITFTADGTQYTIWFPKLANCGEPTSSSGWINTVTDNGYTIIEDAPDSIPDLGYPVSDCIRLAFTKSKNEPYYFAGVFVPDVEHSSYQHHVFSKVADIADFTGSIPNIKYYTKEDAEDDDLITSLKSDTLASAPSSFVYVGKPKKKLPPIVVENRKAYRRDKQTAINALSHAKYHCEIDCTHPTFLRKHSSKPYTEPHHLVPMAFSHEYDVSLDVEENIVSLCSNCHNQLHYGQGAEALLKKLYEERRAVLKQVGIDITFNKLLSYYK